MNHLHRTTNIFLLSSMGDALGTGVHGLKPEAVKAFHKSLTGYVDPEAHLSHRIERWSKPGYYSCVTQFALLLSDALVTPGKSPNSIARLLDAADQRSYTHFRGIFRNTSGGFDDCLDKRNTKEKNNRTQSFFAALAYPFVCRFPDHFDRACDELIRFCLTMNTNSITIAAALAAAAAIHERLTTEMNGDRSQQLAEISRKTAQLELRLKTQYSRELDMLSLPSLGCVSKILQILSEREGTSPLEEAFSLITKHASSVMRQDITRAGHPEPLACVVTGIFLGCTSFPTPHESIIHAAALGQGANITAAVAGAVAAAGIDERIKHPEHFLTGLANYKQIILRAEAVVSGNLSSDMKDFRTMEHNLTQSVSLDLEKLIKKYPIDVESDGPKQKDLLDEIVLKPLIPERKNKRLWRDYEREKSKEKKRRRDFRGNM